MKKILMIATMSLICSAVHAGPIGDENRQLHLQWAIKDGREVVPSADERLALKVDERFNEAAKAEESVKITRLLDSSSKDLTAFKDDGKKIDALKDGSDAHRKMLTTLDQKLASIENRKQQLAPKKSDKMKDGKDKATDMPADSKAGAPPIVATALPSAAATVEDFLVDLRNLKGRCQARLDGKTSQDKLVLLAAIDAFEKGNTKWLSKDAAKLAELNDLRTKVNNIGTESVIPPGGTTVAASTSAIDSSTSFQSGLSALREHARQVVSSGVGHEQFIEAAERFEDEYEEVPNINWVEFTRLMDTVILDRSNRQAILTAQQVTREIDVAYTDFARGNDRINQRKLLEDAWTLSGDSRLTPEMRQLWGDRARRIGESDYFQNYQAPPVELIKIGVGKKAGYFVSDGYFGSGYYLDGPPKDPGVRRRFRPLSEGTGSRQPVVRPASGSGLKLE